MPKRCALGCPRIDVPMHRFPNFKRFPDTFKAWVEIYGGNLNNSNDYEFYSKKTVCDIHFTAEDKNRNNRLNCIAVPSLNLSMVPMKSNANLNITQSSTSTHSPAVSPVASIEEEMDITPDTPALIQPPTKVVPMKYNAYFDITQSSTSTHRPAVAPVASIVEEMDIVTLDTTALMQPPTEDELLTEHNYCKQDIQKVVKICTKSSIKKEPLSVLKKYKAYQRQIKNLKTQLRLSRQQVERLKARLKNTDKINNDFSFQRVAKRMTAAAKIFTKMQFTQTHKAPAGRRFNLDDKILSLSLFMKSPECYDLLAQLFTLPAAKTLKSLLGKIKKTVQPE